MLRKLLLCFAFIQIFCCFVVFGKSIETAYDFVVEYVGAQDPKWLKKADNYLKKYSIDSISSIIEYLEARIGKEAVISSLQKGISHFGKMPTSLQKLKEIVAEYERYLTQEELIDPTTYDVV